MIPAIYWCVQRTTSWQESNIRFYRNGVRSVISYLICLNLRRLIARDNIIYFRKGSEVIASPRVLPCSSSTMSNRSRLRDDADEVHDLQVRAGIKVCLYLFQLLFGLPDLSHSNFKPTRRGLHNIQQSV